MNFVTRTLLRFGILKDDLDYHAVRAAMVIAFLFFGYQKWFTYEAQALIPYISHGPLIFWMYSVFGITGATWFLGVAEWTFGLLLLLGFWNKQFGDFRRPRFMFLLHRDIYDSSLFPQRLGAFYRWFSSND